MGIFRLTICRDRGICSQARYPTTDLLSIILELESETGSQVPFLPWSSEVVPHEPTRCCVGHDNGRSLEPKVAPSDKPTAVSNEPPARIVGSAAGDAVAMSIE